MYVNIRVGRSHCDGLWSKEVVCTMCIVCSYLWNPETSPCGYVSLGMAENSLIDPASNALTYGDDGPSGSKHLKAALACFFNDNFFPARCHGALANPGDGILVGRPYYRAFIIDVEQRPDVRMVPVSFEDIDPLGSGCAAKYEEALLASERAGVKVRAIMLCHPHNPLGHCYPKETIVRIMQFCKKYQIHLISDEIYALSTWQNLVDTGMEHATDFTSVLSIQTEGLISPDLVHANKDLLTACSACAIFSSPSSLAENAVDYIVSDRQFLEAYVAKNKERLSAAYTYATMLLSEHGIEYLPGATAGFFLWVNLGKKWQEKVAADRRGFDNMTIFKALLQEKVFVVSGGSTGAEQPGWFRLVFTQKQEVVAEAIDRIAKIML
ncbi:PLP-dependent transferase [Macroventuria anomochaeta]|uniref:PLP-dependent transferase n=1 Tax=Macroventuria anomochaeta TaxID=301207 RepID=A0ACB6SDH5_9PLEO|nr:PLP-dependent transferase [Macroventuria anomochaeta]KAF2632361.1 PLP-dependent transferase [Macroventuria anomochaeta]